MTNLYKKAIKKYRNDIANKYWGKNYNELNDFHKIQLKAFIHDLEFPQWKKIIINNIICYISNTGIVLDENKEVIKEYENSSKYKTVWIRSKNNKQRNYPRLVHRLVAEAFIPNPENKPQVNHINHNTNLNWVGNLEWVTPKENIRASIKDGNQIVGMKHKNSKFTDEQIHQVCKLLEHPNNNIFEIAQKTGVSIKTINHIRFDNGWPHISKLYNIIKDKRPNGPKYSLISKKIIELLKKKKTNSEIYIELDKLGLSQNISKKSISDRIYNIKHSLVERSTTIDQLG